MNKASKLIISITLLSAALSGFAQESNEASNSDSEFLNIYGDPEFINVNTFIFKHEDKLPSLTEDQKERLVVTLVGEDGTSKFVQDSDISALKDTVLIISFISNKVNFTSDQRDKLFIALLGEDGRSGLARHENKYIRYCAMGALTGLTGFFSSLKSLPPLTASQKDRLLVALLGDEEHTGLIQSTDTQVVLDSIHIIGQFLNYYSYGYRSMLTENETERLFVALAGKDGIGGLARTIDPLNGYNTVLNIIRQEYIKYGREIDSSTRQLLIDNKMISLEARGVVDTIWEWLFAQPENKVRREF